MNKLDNDCISKLVEIFINVSNFNPILKLVSIKFNYFYKKLLSVKRRSWKKYIMYCQYFQKVLNGWKSFKNIWHNNDIHNFYHDRILNNYCQLYLLKNLVHSQCELLIDFYSAYSNISKNRKKIIEFIYKDINTDLINNDYTNFYLITPSFSKDLFISDKNKDSYIYYSFLLGIPNSVYKDGIFIIKLEIFNDTFKKTKVKFLNKIYHPNVCQKTGEINIINPWEPLYGGYPRLLVLNIHHILEYPDSSYFDNVDKNSDNYLVANEYKNDREIFEKKAKKFVKNYAELSLNDMIEILYSETD